MIALLDEIKEKLTQLAAPLCEAVGIDLIELNVRRQGRDVAIQILADRPIGGISMKECSDLNRRMVEAIDESLVLPPEEYSLEVSSPGLDRPLKTRKDFLRVANLEVHFYLNGPLQGKHEHIGVLTEITDESVIVNTEKYGIIEMPIKNIVKALVVL